jgi:TAT (twin-arginine translocation) pathway signal sequence
MAMVGTIHNFDLRGILAAAKPSRRRGNVAPPLPKEIEAMAHTRREFLKTAAGAAAASGTLAFPMVSRAQ